MIGVADVVARVSEAAFGRPLVMNVLRGQVAEAIVAFALEPEWRWCGADYSGWDFDRADGLRLEVKQSARRQSWEPLSDRPPRVGFDVRERTGHWRGATWIGGAGRAADIYVFCHHDRDDDEADHRDPAQWAFHIVAARTLPPLKRIGLASVRRLAPGCSFPELRGAVEKLAVAMAQTHAN